MNADFLSSHPGRAVTCFSPQMTVVFRNLFSNAIKFSKQRGQVAVLVTRSLSAAGVETVTIAVRDSGAGLSKEHIGKLFQGACRVCVRV